MPVPRVPVQLLPVPRIQVPRIHVPRIHVPRINIRVPNPISVVGGLFNKVKQVVDTVVGKVGHVRKLLKCSKNNYLKIK